MSLRRFLLPFLSCLALAPLLAQGGAEDMSSKDGMCPDFPKYTFSPCILYCNKDSDCKGNKKCCSFNCMRKCVEPVF
ncbi:scuwaprin-a-like [Penaeus vannamei]|uniref:scuwaprin-a-like n=1 Tax=Penaeus vannamei TaxID=6689 RepID=UPI00387FA8F2